MVIAEVEEMARGVAFYANVLNLPLVEHSDHWSVFEIGALRLALHTPFSGRGEDRGGWVLCLPVPDVDDLADRLRAAGYPPEPVHETPGGRVLSFHDPDGHRLQALERAP